MTLVPLAQRFNAGGWETFNIDYHPLARSRADVARAYDAVRARVGPNVPDLCHGRLGRRRPSRCCCSVDRPSLACVMSWAGPTDLASVTLPSNPFYGDLQRLATSIHHRLATWSAVSLAHRVHGRVFLLYAASDPVVPPAQGAELHRRLPRSTSSSWNPRLPDPERIVPSAAGEWRQARPDAQIAKGFRGRCTRGRMVRSAAAQTRWQRLRRPFGPDDGFDGSRPPAASGARS